MGFIVSFSQGSAESSSIKLLSWGLAELGARAITDPSHLDRLTIVEFVAFLHQVQFRFA